MQSISTSRKAAQDENPGSGVTGSAGFESRTTVGSLRIGGEPKPNFWRLPPVLACSGGFKCRNIRGHALHLLTEARVGVNLFRSMFVREEKDASQRLSGPKMRWFVR
jgi:hypothetical protein